MRYRCYRSVCVLAVIVLFTAVACAPAPEKKAVELVWPLPPDEPRIKYVDLITSTLDLGKKSSLAESLFGEEQVEGFFKPYGVAVDREGRMYVTDLTRVIVFDFSQKDYFFLGAGAGTGEVRMPIGIAAAEDGRIFVTDVVLNRVFVYRDRQFVGSIGATGELQSPTGVALDEKRGLVYVVDSKKHTVSVHSLANYSKIRNIGKRGEGNGEFNYPTNIAVDNDGNIYVVDTGNFRIEVFNANGNYLKSIGKLGDSPGSLARPKGIALDSEGHIYVVDTAFQNFQIFDKEGSLLLFVGDAGTGPGHFKLPAGLTIDKDDKIYVVDQFPPAVQIFQYLGEKWRKKQESPSAGGQKKG